MCTWLSFFSSVQLLTETQVLVSRVHFTPPSRHFGRQNRNAGARAGGLYFKCCNPPSNAQTRGHAAEIQRRGSSWWEAASCHDCALVHPGGQEKLAHLSRLKFTFFGLPAAPKTANHFPNSPTTLLASAHAGLVRPSLPPPSPSPKRGLPRPQRASCLSSPLPQPSDFSGPQLPHLISPCSVGSPLFCFWWSYLTTTSGVSLATRVREVPSV